MKTQKEHKKETLMRWTKEELANYIMFKAHNINVVSESFDNQYHNCVKLLDEMKLINETYFEAKQIVKQIVKQSEWISVDERLPEKNGYYLVYTKYGYIEVERYKTWDDDDLDGGYWWEFEGLVTHWMPLPEAPKMKGGE